ncbi:MAG: cytochrome b5 domain-containing protein [Candidatus Nanoarchaeia archaeon]
MVSKNTIYIMLFVAVLFIAGCTAEGAVLKKSSLSMPEETETQEMTVAEHNQPEDCWVIVEEGVYDITPLIGQVSGYEVTESCGKTMDMRLLKDNLDLNSLAEARGRLQDYYIGEAE